MPAPSKPKVIRVVVTSGSDGELVTIRNLTQNQKVTVAVQKAEIVYNPIEDGYSWANGDSLVVEMNGRINDVTTATISGGGVTATLSGSATTSMANVLL